MKRPFKDVRPIGPFAQGSGEGLTLTIEYMFSDEDIEMLDNDKKIAEILDNIQRETNQRLKNESASGRAPIIDVNRMKLGNRGKFRIFIETEVDVLSDEMIDIMLKQSMQEFDSASDGDVSFSRYQVIR